MTFPTPPFIDSGMSETMNLFRARSALCAEVTLPGDQARAISDYVNDLRRSLRRAQYALSTFSPNKVAANGMQEIDDALGGKA